MIYKLSDKNGNYSSVRRVALADIGWKEKDLETLIAKNIEDFISSSDLMTIFTERKGQEAPDILALDKKGDLYIFELKREQGKQENLLQVLRYGQLYGDSKYDELNSFYRQFVNDKNADLSEEHKKHFDLSETVDKNKFNSTQHFLIMTNGIDQKTMKAIQYWKKVGLNIDAVVYWIYEIGGEHYIEFNTYSYDKQKIQYETKAYIINTDLKNFPKHHESMLAEHKAAAYGNGYKEKIEKLQNGDTVFLYQSGVGIVAYGIADGIVNKVDEDDEYNMNLNDYIGLDEPLEASKIKQIAERNLIFTQTMFAIPDDAAEKIIKAIEHNHSSK